MFEGGKASNFNKSQSYFFVLLFLFLVFTKSQVLSNPYNLQRMYPELRLEEIFLESHVCNNWM